MAQPPAKKETEKPSGLAEILKNLNLAAGLQAPIALRRVEKNQVLGPPDAKGNSQVLATVERDTTAGGIVFTGFGRAEIVQGRTPWLTGTLISETPSPKFVVGAGLGLSRETREFNLADRTSAETKTHLGTGAGFGLGVTSFADFETVIGNTKIINPDGSTLMAVAVFGAGLRHVTRKDVPDGDTENTKRHATEFTAAAGVHVSLGGGSQISEAGPFQLIVGQTPPQQEH